MRMRGGVRKTGTRGRPSPPPRYVGYVLALLLATGGLVFAGPAASPADAASVCHGRATRTVAFATGELRLYRTRQYVCAVAVAKRPGGPRTMTVSLRPRGGRAAVNSGRFTRQAGPVTVYALNRCVQAAATIDGRSTATGWILC